VFLCRVQLELDVMRDDAYTQLAIFFLAGIGLLAAGCANLLLNRRSGWLRAAATASIAALGIATAWVWTDNSAATAQCGLILACGLAACLAVGSERLASSIAVLARSVRLPAVRWSIVALIGVGTAGAAILHHEYSEERLVDRQMTDLEILTTQPPLAASLSTRATTDQGHPVPIKDAIAPRGEAMLGVIEEDVINLPMIRENVIRRQPASDHTNCHGWIFTGGRCWIMGSEVEQILSDNRYQVVVSPKPGDLVIYRNGSLIIHSAVVRYAPDGQSVLIEGKWGCGGVFVHPPDKSIYGLNFSYYRSPRQGHVLAGIESHSSPNPTQVPEAMRPDEYTE